MPKKPTKFPLLDDLKLDFGKIADDNANDRVIAQGVSVRLKTFIPYRKLCKMFGMNFCAPIQQFMELFVDHYRDPKVLEAALKRYGKEAEEQKPMVKKTRIKDKEKKPCDRLYS